MSNDTDKTAARDALLARVERTIAVPWRRIDLSPADVRALLDMARTSLPITAFYAERDALRAEVKRLHGLVVGARNLIDPEKHKAWEDAAAKESVACDERIARLETVLAESNAVCACGCPPAEHDDLGEDGESCGRDAHECVRTCVAVRDMLTSLHADSRARFEAEALRRGIELEVDRADEDSADACALRQLLDTVDAVGSVAVAEEIHALRGALSEATPLMEFLAHAEPGEPIAGDAPLGAAAWVREYGR